MQTQNRLFDDLAKVASSAVNTLGGVREEVELRVKERIERLANEMDLVPREEFDAMSELARNARSAQAEMAEKIAALEARIEALEAKAKPSRRKSPGGS